MGQWLRLHASTAGGTGSIPGRRTNIRMLHRMSKKKKKLTLHFYFINTLYSSGQFCTPRNTDACFYSLTRKGGRVFLCVSWGQDSPNGDEARWGGKREQGVVTHPVRIIILPKWVSLVAQTVNNLLAVQETRVPSLERKWQSTPVFLPGEFRGQRSLAGYSLWDRKESTRLTV